MHCLKCSVFLICVSRCVYTYIYMNCENPVGAKRTVVTSRKNTRGKIGKEKIRTIVTVQYSSTIKLTVIVKPLRNILRVELTPIIKYDYPLFDILRKRHSVGLYFNRSQLFLMFSYFVCALIASTLYPLSSHFDISSFFFLSLSLNFSLNSRQRGWFL